MYLRSSIPIRSGTFAGYRMLPFQRATAPPRKFAPTYAASSASVIVFNRSAAGSFAQGAPYA